MDAAKSGTRPYRLGAFIDGVGWVEHSYGRVWERIGDQIMAAPDEGHVKLILSLTEELDGPFGITYFLLVPREDAQEEARLVMTTPLERRDLTSFLVRYRELFENDGRHHLWITTPESRIVYDQHNVLCLSGPVERFERVLRDAGLRAGEVTYPSPHSHHYHQELDSVLDDMLERYEWQWYPLDARSD